MNPFLSAMLSSALVDRRDGHRRAVLADFSARPAAERLSPDARRAVMDGRLAMLLAHAAANVPWFRGKLPVTTLFKPEEARGILDQLPVLTRRDIQEHLPDMISETATDLRDDATGGSTGTPMSFKVDRETQRAREASLMWANSLAGWRPGEKIAMLWGSDRDVRGSTAERRLALRWWIENLRWYNAFDMGEDRMARFHRDLSAFRPDFLVAYAGSVFTFARYLRDKDIQPRYPRKGIVSSAEMLAPPMRAVVEEVFGRPVFDRYGNRELGAIAAECEAHAGLHVNETDCIVEIDSGDPFRTEGRILVTYLRNFAMPFIRYDTGDIGRFESAEPCACGRTSLRLARVTGRVSDTIRTSAGNLIHGEYFTHLLYGAAGVREFQFVQEAPDRYVLRLAADRAAAAPREAEWTERIREAVGGQADVRIEYVDSIPAMTSGKRRFTVACDELH